MSFVVDQHFVLDNFLLLELLLVEIGTFFKKQNPTLLTQ